MMTVSSTAQRGRPLYTTSTRKRYCAGAGGIEWPCGTPRRHGDLRSGLLDVQSVNIKSQSIYLFISDVALRNRGI
jgi:hypothetical protein